MSIVARIPADPAAQARRPIRWAPIARRSTLFTIGAILLLEILVSAAPTFGQGATHGVSAPEGAHLGLASSAHFAVTFTRTGIPFGTKWTVGVNGSGGFNSSSSTGNSLTFGVPNGTYSFFPAYDAWGTSVSGPTGSFTVSGASVSKTVNFVQVFNVTFDESGLPSGTLWGVTMGGVNYSSNLSANSSSLQFLAPNGSYAYRAVVSAGYDLVPSSGTLTVSGSNTTVSLSGRLQIEYTVTFVETGLPAGVTWTVGFAGFLNGTSSSNAAGVSFSVPNGTYYYWISTSAMFQPSPGSGGVTIAGSNTTVAIQFVRTFSLLFQETGLAAGTLWSVYLNNSVNNGSSAFWSTGSTLQAEMPNGTYSVVLGSVTGYGMTGGPGSVIVIAGSNFSTSVRFHLLPGYYALSFTAVSLPNQTLWWVFVSRQNSTSVGADNTTGTNLSFGVQNGSYHFVVSASSGVSVTPWNATVNVSGANVTVRLKFAPPQIGHYQLLFLEFGLPKNQSFDLNLSGLRVSSSITLVSNGSSPGAAYSFREVNGSYRFTISKSGSYSPTPSAGMALLNGTNLTISVNFSRTSTSTYTVGFSATGVPSGANWSVDLSGTNRTSTNSTISFSEPNGSYAYTVSCGAGYNASPSSGYANVSGSAVSVSINCTNSSGLVPVHFAARGLGPSVLWSVTLSAGSTGATIELVRSVTKSAGATSLITFDVTPGTYAYTAQAAGYELASGSLDAGSRSSTITVSFTGTGTTEPPNTLAGLPVGAVVAGGIAVAAILALVLALSVRGRRVTEAESGRLLVEEIGQTEWSRGLDGEPTTQDLNR